MNVYIYGNNSFKKDIHDTLEHANLKFKLDSDSVIKEINSLEELKTIIKQNPNDIYLIDDEKIIKKNGISKKLKFLNPKDGIEEEYLLDHGIADLSVDSLKDIPKYILEKHEQQKANSNEDIRSSIEDIVDDAYSEDDSNYYDDINLEKKQNESTNSDDSLEEDFDDEFELDDELASLLEKSDDDVDIEVMDNKNDDKSDNSNELNDSDDFLNFDDIGLNNSEFDYDDKSIINDEEENEKEDEQTQDDELDSLMNELDDYEVSDNDYDEPTQDYYDSIEELDNNDNNKFESENEPQKDKSEQEHNQENDTIKEDKKGARMSDEFAELDGLNEQDILSALNGLDEIKISNKKNDNNSLSKTDEKPKESLELNSSNSQDIVELLTKLLNNKTLEITVKIKD